MFGMLCKNISVFSLFHVCFAQEQPKHSESRVLEKSCIISTVRFTALKMNNVHYVLQNYVFSDVRSPESGVKRFTFHAWLFPDGVFVSQTFL